MELRKNSAAKKDVLSSFILALRKNNLKVGLYYSLPDWSYNDYTHFTREENRYNIEDEPEREQAEAEAGAFPEVLRNVDREDGSTPRDPPRSRLCNRCRIRRRPTDLRSAG